MIQVNNRIYQPRSAPVVGICVDGNAPAYFEAAAEVMPNQPRSLSGPRTLLLLTP